MAGDGTFAAAYEVEPEPEFPGDGEWGCPVYGYAADGVVSSDFESRWGAPTVLRVTTQSGTESVLMFAAGGLGGESGIFACPAPEDLCVVAAGQAYLVDTRMPEGDAVVLRSDTQEVVPLPHEGLLLLSGFQNIVAVGINGVVWRSPRLAHDGLHVDYARAGRIFCHAEDMSGWFELEVDAATGNRLASP
jgi:hypothetical protein